MSKPITELELRQQVLDHMHTLVDYWADESRTRDTKSKLDGLAFSILSMFDGCSSFPGFDIVARPHPDDKRYHIDNEEDWIEDGTMINSDCMLHEFWYTP